VALKRAGIIIQALLPWPARHIPFDDIVDHLIMGQGMARSTITFLMFARLQEGTTMSFVPARPESLET